MILPWHRFALNHEFDLPLSFFVLWWQLILVWSHLYMHLVGIQFAIFWLVCTNRRSLVINHVAVWDSLFCQESKRWLYILLFLIDIFQLFSIEKLILWSYFNRDRLGVFS